MGTETLDDMQLRSAQIRAAKPLLWAALGLAVLAVLGMVARAPVLSVIGWFGGWIAGPLALSRVAPAIGTPPLLKYPLFIACALPVFSLAAPVYGLLASRRQHAELETALTQAQARERRREREAQAREAPAAGRAAPPAVPPAPVRAAAATPAARVADVLPVVRMVSDGLREGGELQVRAAGLPPDAELPPLRGTAGVFGVGYHVDAGSHWTSVSRAEMRSLGLDLEALHRQALANLAKLVKGQPGLRVIEDKAKSSYSGLLLDGDHEACLVLLDGLWDQALKSRTPNGAVVSIPSRDVLAFCDAGSAAGIAQLREAARRITPGTQGALSQQLLLRRDGRWALFNG